MFNEGDSNKLSRRQFLLFFTAATLESSIGHYVPPLSPDISKPQEESSQVYIRYQRLAENIAKGIDDTEARLEARRDLMAILPDLLAGGNLKRLEMSEREEDLENRDVISIKKIVAQASSSEEPIARKNLVDFNQESKIADAKYEILLFGRKNGSNIGELFNSSFENVSNQESTYFFEVNQGEFTQFLYQNGEEFIKRLRGGFPNLDKTVIELEISNNNVNLSGVIEKAYRELLGPKLVIESTTDPYAADVFQFDDNGNIIGREQPTEIRESIVNVALSANDCSFQASLNIPFMSFGWPEPFLIEANENNANISGVLFSQSTIIRKDYPRRTSANSNETGGSQAPEEAPNINIEKYQTEFKTAVLTTALLAIAYDPPMANV